MTIPDRQTVNLRNANSWSCPWRDCDFEGTSYDRWKHILDAHE